MIYAGDSAADEFAITRLKGVACTFRVINEDSNVITKTCADYRLQGMYDEENAQEFYSAKAAGFVSQGKELDDRRAPENIPQKISFSFRKLELSLQVRMAS